MYLVNTRAIQKVLGIWILRIFCPNFISILNAFLSASECTVCCIMPATCLIHEDLGEKERKEKTRLRKNKRVQDFKIGWLEDGRGVRGWGGEPFAQQWDRKRAVFTAATVEPRNFRALQHSVSLSSAALRCGVELQSPRSWHSSAYRTCVWGNSSQRRP